MSGRHHAEDISIVLSRIHGKRREDMLRENKVSIQTYGEMLRRLKDNLFRKDGSRCSTSSFDW